MAFHQKFGLDTDITQSSLKRTTSSHSLIPPQALNADILFLQTYYSKKLLQNLQTPFLLGASSLSLTCLPPPGPSVSFPHTDTAHRQGVGTWPEYTNREADSRDFSVAHSPNQSEIESWVIEGSWLELFHTFTCPGQNMPLQPECSSPAQNVSLQMFKPLSIFCCCACIRLEALYKGPVQKSGQRFAVL